MPKTWIRDSSSLCIVQNNFVASIHRNSHAYHTRRTTGLEVPERVSTLLAAHAIALGANAAAGGLLVTLAVLLSGWRVLEQRECRLVSLTTAHAITSDVYWTC